MKAWEFWSLSSVINISKERNTRAVRYTGTDFVVVVAGTLVVDVKGLVVVVVVVVCVVVVVVAVVAVVVVVDDAVVEVVTFITIRKMYKLDKQNALHVLCVRIHSDMKVVNSTRSIEKKW